MDRHPVRLYGGGGGAAAAANDDVDDKGSFAIVSYNGISQ
jgi:hypothetical protein